MCRRRGFSASKFTIEAHADPASHIASSDTHNSRLGLRSRLLLPTCYWLDSQGCVATSGLTRTTYITAELRQTTLTFRAADWSVPLSTLVAGFLYLRRPAVTGDAVLFPLITIWILACRGSASSIRVFLFCSAKAGHQLTTRQPQRLPGTAHPATCRCRFELRASWPRNRAWPASEAWSSESRR